MIKLLLYEGRSRERKQHEDGEKKKKKKKLLTDFYMISERDCWGQ